MFKFSSNSSPIFQSIPALPEHKEFLQPNQNSIVNYDEKSRTLDPTTTGTSVLGIKCRDFVMIASILAYPMVPLHVIDQFTV